MISSINSKTCKRVDDGNVVNRWLWPLGFCFFVGTADLLIEELNWVGWSFLKRQRLIPFLKFNNVRIWINLYNFYITGPSKFHIGPSIRSYCATYVSYVFYSTCTTFEGPTAQFLCDVGGVGRLVQVVDWCYYCWWCRIPARKPPGTYKTLLRMG